MASGTDDKLQIGLTPAGSQALTVLTESSKLFATESDAYKLAIAYAIAAGLEPDDAPGKGYQTKFNAGGGLDRDGTIRDLIAVCRPQDADRPYATAEKLAEIGITSLASRLASHETLADILLEFDDE